MRHLSPHSTRVLAPALVALFTPNALAQYQGQEIWTQLGTTSNQLLGSSVANAGDVDGDGVDDMIAGAPGADGLAPASGVVFIYSGADGSVIWEIPGDDTGDDFGWSVDGVGDLDGDGRADFIVGIPGDGSSSGPSVGSLKVYSGATGSVLLANGGGVQADRFGTSVAGVGDLNADGVPDYVVGDPQDDASGANRGRAEVHSGANGNQLYGWNGGDYVFPGLGLDARALGSSVAAAGDFDGDGTEDIIVGALYGAIVFSGSTGAVINYVDAGLASGIARSVAGIGDFNGDGRSEVLIGEPTDDLLDDNAGRATIYSYSGLISHPIASWYGSEAGQRLGWSVGAAGDFNGDGTPDLLVGSLAYGPESRGLVQVYSGSDWSLITTMVGAPWLDFLGTAIDGAGDVNGDGFADVLLGAPRSDTSPIGQHGKVLVISGGPDPIQPYCDSLPNSTGSAATIHVSGSTSVAANDLVLSAAPVPNAPGIFFLGPNQVSLPFGDGIRCVGGSIQRLPVSIASGNTLTTAVDNTWAFLNGSMTPGALLNFQAWFRDTAAGGAGFNTSGAVRLQFQP